MLIVTFSCPDHSCFWALFRFTWHVLAVTHNKAEKISKESFTVKFTKFEITQLYKNCIIINMNQSQTYITVHVMLTLLRYRLVKCKTSEEIKLQCSEVRFGMEWYLSWSPFFSFFLFFSGHGPTIDFTANDFTLFHLSACCSNVPRKQARSK